MCSPRPPSLLGINKLIDTLCQIILILNFIIDRRGVVLSITETKSMNKSQSRDTVISNKGFEVPNIPVNQVMCSNLF